MPDASGTPVRSESLNGQAAPLAPHGGLAATPAGRRNRPPNGGVQVSVRNAEDDALIARAAGGDDLAWRDLADRYLDDLVGFAWYLLSDRAEAEDVAQECFLKLIDKVPHWQREGDGGGAGLRTWLHRVARNLSIDRMRRRKSLSPAALDDLAPAAQPVTNHAGDRLQMDRAHHVRAALDALPGRQREALVLTHYQGFTQYEAADLMDLTTDAVESLLARGRRALKTALAPVQEDLL